MIRASRGETYGQMPLVMLKSSLCKATILKVRPEPLQNARGQAAHFWTIPSQGTTKKGTTTAEFCSNGASQIYRIPGMS